MIKLPDEWKLSDAEEFIRMCTPPSFEEASLFAWNACLAEVQRLDATAQPVSDGLVPVPDEFLYADQNAKGMFELSEDCMCRLLVALSQQSKGLVVKPGYALLPIEPTEEMLAAGSATDGGLYCIWKDMLAAAPGGQGD